MALALDASTPSMVKGTTTPATTAAFSPPAGSLLFAICEADELNTFSVSGGGLTWTSIGVSTNQSGEGSIQVYWAYTATALTGITISSARTGSFTANALKVLVFTGAETSFTGAKAAAFATTVNVTTTANNSWVWAGHIEENGGADTAATGCTFNDAETTFGGIGGGVLKRTATTPASGTVVTIGVTSATIPAIVAFEVKEGAGSTTQGGTSTALHPGKGPTWARFYQTPRSADVTSTTLTLSDTATGAAAGIPAVTAAIGVVLADTAGGVRAGDPNGEQAVNSIVLADPGVGSSRAGGGSDSIAVGVALTDTMSGVRGGTPAETLANGIVLLDVVSGVRAGAPNDTLAIGTVLTDTAGGTRAGDPLGETATAALSLSDPSAGSGRAGSTSGSFTIGVALNDTAGGIRLGTPTGVLSFAVVLADTSGGVRAGSKTDSLSFGAVTGFVCQDFTTTAVVDAYSGVATVDAYSATRTVDAYAGSFSVDAYTGSATNCGR